MQNYRHGDIRLKRIEFIPEESTKTEESYKYIVAHGEATGHKHCLESSNIQVWLKDDAIYLVLENTGILTHQEHNRINIHPGCYEVIHEREYDPFSKEHRQAYD